LLMGVRSRRFSAEGDFIERLEGPDRRRLVPTKDIIPRLGITKRDAVIDLGSGIGYFSIPLAKIAGSVLALDLEPKMLAVLSERIRTLKMSNIHMVAADMTSLPIADGSVDHVFAAFVYHEVPRPIRLIEESHRVLQIGGMLTIIDFQKWETPIGPPVSERKTPEQVERAASRFLIERSRHETDVYYQLTFAKS